MVHSAGFYLKSQDNLFFTKHLYLYNCQLEEGQLSKLEIGPVWSSESPIYK